MVAGLSGSGESTFDFHKQMEPGEFLSASFDVFDCWVSSQAMPSYTCKDKADTEAETQPASRHQGDSTIKSRAQQRSSTHRSAIISYSRQDHRQSSADSAQTCGVDTSNVYRGGFGVSQFPSIPSSGQDFKLYSQRGGDQISPQDADYSNHATFGSAALGSGIELPAESAPVTTVVRRQPLFTIVNKYRSRDSTLDSESYNSNGRLPDDTRRRYKMREDFMEQDELDRMESENTGPPGGDESTQVIRPTQEVAAPLQRSGGSALTLNEELDIICFLRPVTEAAFEVVKNVADDTPQHYFRNQGLSRKQRQVVETYEGNAAETENAPLDTLSQATPELQATQESSNPGEIALRLSSRVRDLDMGFVFGRDARKSDILVNVGNTNTIRISGMHFRIFVNDNGMIMVEDTSTNGTFVDSILLKYKKPLPGNSVRRMIANNSMIELLVDDSRRTARFVVSVPQRRDEHAWKTRLQGYLAEVRRVRTQKTNALRNLAIETEPDPKQESNDSDDRGDMTLFTAGTMPYNHGMRWTGGDDYNVVGKLGSGAFATVYKLINVHTGNLIAAKEIEKRRFMQNNTLDMKITTELQIMKNSDHPHILHCFDHIDTPRDLYILMEFVPFGDLGQHLSSATKLSDADLRFVAKQMCQALAYLHDNGIAHRDIKPENILKRSTNPMWVKLADFGLSKVVSQGDNTVYQTFCGTLLYCAPEVYPGYAAKRRGEKLEKKPKTDPYSVAVDIWSFAAVMFHLVCSTPPYEASAANYGVHMLDAILHERFPHTKYEEAGVSPEWESFFLNSLQMSAVERWSARRLLKLPFMQQIRDVVPINHRYKHPDNVFAHEDESSDEDEAGDAVSMIENDLDASQLSISDAAQNDADANGDSFMSGSEQVPDSRAGLGIEGLHENVGKNGLRLHTEASSRYNLRARSGPARQLDPQTPRKQRHAPAAAASLTPAVPQQAGKLFGEIGDSGVFGSAANTPRIVNPSAATSGKHSPRLLHQDISSQAEEIAAGNYSPVARRTYLRGAESAASLRGAVGQIDNLRMGSPDMDASNMVGSQNTQTDSVRIKHTLHDEDDSVSAKAKRSKTAESVRRISSSSLIREVPQAERPETPEAAVDEHSSNQETPRARKAGVKSLAFPSGPRSSSMNAESGGNPPLPDTAVAQTFPKIARPPQFTPNAQDAPVTPGHLSLAQTMAPPPRRASTNSSRPPTPVMQSNPENPLVPALGVLSPGRSSIAVETVYVTLAKTEWGRSPECTHVYPKPQDVRVSKSAFTIMLWDPATGRKAEQTPDFDWTKSNFYAVISTRCSGHIRINGVPMSRRRSNDEKAQLGVLRTGDVVEVMHDDKKGEHLRFHVHFWFGASKQERNDKTDAFRVLIGEEALKQAIEDAEATTSTRSDRTITQ